MYAPQPLKIRFKQVGLDDVEAILERVQRSALPWRDKRKGVESALARHTGFPAKDVRDAVGTIMPACSAAQAWKRLRSPTTLRELGLGADTIADWRAIEADGPVQDELNVRFNSSATRYLPSNGWGSPYGRSSTEMDWMDSRVPWQLRP